MSMFDALQNLEDKLKNEKDEGEALTLAIANGKAGVDSAAPTLPPFVITDRLKLLVCPSKLKNHCIAKPKLPKKQKILHSFTDLPHDVVLEITSYLDIPDLLALSRVSKRFREVFMSQSARTVWLQMFKNLGADLKPPECPQDLSLPSYASLLFDDFCMACLSERGKIETQYHLRLRLCAGCSKANLVTGEQAISRIIGSERQVLSLVASSGLRFVIARNNFETYHSRENDHRLSYFAPELQAIYVEYKSREKMGPIVLNAFVQEQQENATRMMREGLFMSFWSSRLEQATVENERRVAEVRRERIYDEMVSLGWERKYFPAWTGLETTDTELYDEWEDFVTQPKLFSMRDWNKNKTAMQALYERSRKNIITRERAAELHRRYSNFRESLPKEEQRKWIRWQNLKKSSVCKRMIIKSEEVLSDAEFEEFLGNIRVFGSKTSMASA